MTLPNRCPTLVGRRDERRWPRTLPVVCGMALSDGLPSPNAAEVSAVDAELVAEADSIDEALVL